MVWDESHGWVLSVTDPRGLGSTLVERLRAAGHPDARIQESFGPVLVVTDPDEQVVIICPA